MENVHFFFFFNKRSQTAKIIMLRSNKVKVRILRTRERDENEKVTGAEWEIVAPGRRNHAGGACTLKIHLITCFVFPILVSFFSIMTSLSCEWCKKHLWHELLDKNKSSDFGKKVDRVEKERDIFHLICLIADRIADQPLLQ